MPFIFLAISQFVGYFLVNFSIFFQFIWRFTRFCRVKNILVQIVFVQNRFSKHRPSGPMLSISRFVHMFVCLCVRLSVHF